MTNLGIPAKMVWIDFETTGLEESVEVPLEIGLKVTDELGRTRDEWKSLIYMDNPTWHDAINNADEFVKNMHTISGLWDSLNEAISSHEVPSLNPSCVEESAITWLKSHSINRNTLPAAGSTVHFDRNFLRKYMPLLNKFFTYRNIDVSGMREIMKLLNPQLAAQEPKKREIHRVLEDLDDSIGLYQFAVRDFLMIGEDLTDPWFEMFGG